MKTGTTALLATLLAAGSILAGCGGGSSGPEVRSTTYGEIVGVDDSASSGTYYWQGVPYAKPPVGDLRWKAPVEPTAWGAPLQAKKFGNACIQNGRLYGPGANNTYDATIGTTLNTPVGSEDCLTLNIWRPATGDANLPVIFFIYGGSNISGYSADPVYNGANLAKTANAVVVTANYRVGPFGFFNMPQLKTGANALDDSGNYAILDQIQVLKFIQNNIGNFGGNKGNVTIMGQSAGAINVYALLTSPLTAGLFHKAIPLSGGISFASELPPGSIAIMNPASTYQAQATSLLYNLLIADGLATDTASAQQYAATQSNAQIAAYLRGKSASTLLGTLLAKGLTGSNPIPDGAVVSTDPIAAINAGNYRKVPILAGNTTEEGKLFASFLALSPALGGKPGFIVSDATRFNMMFNFNGDAPTTLTDASIIDPYYLPVDTPTTGYNARTALVGNLLFTSNRDSVLNALRTQQSNVWYYQFAWKQNPAPWNDVYGAAHAYDLPFVFGNFGPSLFSSSIVSTANRPGRLALSNAMMSVVAAFARNGDPNTSTLGVNWEPWPKKLTFDASLTQAQISTQ
ncbi:MAG TPA: carboxylesterase family protein [Noviherbaspirillum sp.]|uniref:carboxylesterase/lipase family protein n=1 Tax=Noviherbaspirillum sp. TaxID=1926288 RepID=UPI002B4604B1|nr:carboxylesterase family protein [Noviherbaspirillum sp.]HJV86471.1 carboxylesterase family protein [Noviherbaspirillum sp.]